MLDISNATMVACAARVCYSEGRPGMKSTATEIGRIFKWNENSFGHELRTGAPAFSSVRVARRSGRCHDNKVSSRSLFGRGFGAFSFSWM